MTRLITLILLCVLSAGLHAQITFNKNILVMENELVKQTISFNDGKIIPGSVFSKDHDLEMLSGSIESSWFEFVVNNRLIASNMPIWKVISHDVRPLNNGGSEIKIVVEATRQVRGLNVEIYRQIFPNTSLIRERIILRGDSKLSFSLNKLDGDLHFVFPRYSLSGHSEADSITETRIASFDKEVLDDYNINLTWDDRRQGYNLSQCHMFHPDVISQALVSGDSFSGKGPFVKYMTPAFSWMMTYEHASQDKNYGSEFGNALKRNPEASGIDQMQGVIGASGIVEKPDDYWFLAISGLKNSESTDMYVEILRGGYLEGEVISYNKPYESVWSTSSFFFNQDDEKMIMHDYLWKYITENRASRKSHFYYNTWGMQRDNTNRTGLREIFTEKRILEEIKYASDLNVDLFVLDDGWEQAMGVWRPNKDRLPKGLAPLISEMKNNNMIPGIWLSPMGIDSMAPRYLENPQWVLRDKDGVPIKAQWGFPAFDFVSGFYDLFVADCKMLIDDGVRFFKWDAINTFNSTLPDLDHGSSKNTKEEIRDRYGFMLPFYITRAMRELREYNPEVVVEIDLTEKERCIIGLMPLQEGKLFWMNNGASSYNDYSTYRTKSMRNVLNEYGGMIPNELFTQAVYPHQVRPFDAQRYNVNTSLVGGRGFWGNLKLMSEQQRKMAGALVAKSKLVLPQIEDLPINVQGKIGSSPEIYSHVNVSAGAGQIIGFSGSALKYTFINPINTDNCLAVLNHAYKFIPDTLELPFEFSKPEDTREAFIIPNRGSGISIVSSSGWLDAVELNNLAKRMTIKAGGATELVLRFPDNLNNISAKGSALKNVSEPDSGRYNYFELGLKAGEPIIVEWQ